MDEAKKILTGMDYPQYLERKLTELIYDNQKLREDFLHIKEHGTTRKVVIVYDHYAVEPYVEEAADDKTRELVVRVCINEFTKKY